jgi:hypothetical protein
LGRAGVKVMEFLRFTCMYRQQWLLSSQMIAILKFVFITAGYTIFYSNSPTRIRPANTATMPKIFIL